MDDPYEGMTVNERLFASGNMDDFDKAVQNKDVEKVMQILRSVGLTNKSIDPILKRAGLLTNQ